METLNPRQTSTQELEDPKLNNGSLHHIKFTDRKSSFITNSCNKCCSNDVETTPVTCNRYYDLNCSKPYNIDETTQIEIDSIECIQSLFSNKVVNIV